jgi:hypothetical protein
VRHSDIASNSATDFNDRGLGANNVHHIILSENNVMAEFTLPENLIALRHKP